MPETLQIKNTLNLPRTAFAMKANLPQREPKMLKRWTDGDVYGQIRAARKGKPVFVLHDGPPYANGAIHMGTAINKIIKDLIVKSRSMMGYDTPYVPGWDCHGLPIEIKVEENLGERKAGMDKVAIRKACRKYAERFISVQREGFKRLGIFGEWDNPYLTMNHSYQAEIVRAFGAMVGKGLVYRGMKPVHWCASCKTALAEAEVEYEQHTSPSIYVAFPVRSDLSVVDPALAGQDWYVVIWTTTPWTLPANLAVAFHPDLNYAAVRVGGRGYIIASDLLERVSQLLGWTDPKVVARFPGRVLDRLEAAHPLIDRKSTMVMGNYVTLEQGTGCVHTAPGHGYDDYLTGVQYGLDILCPVDDEGRFVNSVDRYAGQHVRESNPKIVEDLRRNGALLHFEDFHHQYPHCWRCHNPILFRATPQWFVALDHDGYRERVLGAIKDVRWIPKWGEERIGHMVKDRPDWCISRQRDWGVPIVAFYCTACGEVLLDESVIDHVATIFEAEGADAWYAKEASALIPAGAFCAKCHGTGFRKEFDILDVWFDSGSSHLATLGDREDLPWPADLYIEGGDQYRGWFQSSLLIGVALRERAPYRITITHGWTLDEQGRAMSKSKGIGIDPNTLVQERGAEVARLLVSSVSYVEDVRIFDELLDRLSEAYKKIRNTCRFVLGNLSNQLDKSNPRFDPAADQVAYDEMLEIDRWALARTAILIQRCLKSYEDFQFHQAYSALYYFCTVEMSSFYFDILKDRLYTHATRSPSRRSAQTALHYILDAVTRLMAPMLPFTAEEVWTVMREGDEKESVHAQLFPQVDAQLADSDLLGEWEKIRDVREIALKELEEARKTGLIGSPLEAKLIIHAGSSVRPLLERHLEDLRYIFIVSQVELIATDDSGLRIEVNPADGQKCDRCWNYSTKVGADNDFSSLCERCAPVVRTVNGSL